jgi:hypothetical protein
VWSLSSGPHCAGSLGGFLLDRTSEEPSNRGVFHGATAYMALMGLLVLVVAVALWLQKRGASAPVFPSAVGLGVTLRDGPRRVLAWRRAAWTGMCGWAACVVLGPGSGRRGQS